MMRSEMRRLRGLEQENGRPKKIAGELALDNEMQQDGVKRKLRGLTGRKRWSTRCGWTEAVGPNEVRAMDCVHDQLATGRRIRVLAVVDTLSRFVPVLDPVSALGPRTWWHSSIRSAPGSASVVEACSSSELLFEFRHRVMLLSAVGLGGTPPVGGRR